MTPTYEKTEPFQGDPRRAIDYLNSTLSAAGFRIESVTESFLSASSPRMYNSKQNPLLNASKIEFRASGSTITAQAVMNGSVWMMWVLIWTFVGLSAMFGVMAFMLPGWGKIALPMRFLMMEGPLLPWPILLPVLFRWMRKRGCRAIDTLIHNAALTASR